MTSVYPGHALVPRTPHRTPAGNGFVLQGPWGARSGGWRPSRAGPFSHGQLLRSRRVSEGKTWTWNDPTKQSPRWVHPQAKAPVPLTPKFSCSSLFLFLFSFLDLFFQLDQYIFQRSITPPTPFLLPFLPSSPLPHHQHPHLIQSHLVNSSYSSHGEEKAFHVYSPFRSASSSLHLPPWCVERVYCALIMSVGVCVSVGHKERKKERQKDYHFWMC